MYIFLVGGTTTEKKVPKKPRSQPDNVCFFHDVNLLGGDIPESKGGGGVKMDDANNCAVACYQNELCK